MTSTGDDTENRKKLFNTIYLTHQGELNIKLLEHETGGRLMAKGTPSIHFNMVEAKIIYALLEKGVKPKEIEEVMSLGEGTVARLNKRFEAIERAKLLLGQEEAD